MENQIHDVVILGGGSAGLTAAIYACRSRLSTLMIERFFPGGQLMMCEMIENFPGFPDGTSGCELGAAMQKQAEKFGMLTRYAEVVDMQLAANPKVLRTADGDAILGKTVILCLGAKPRLLGVPGEAEFIGKGVSYCAVCDGALFAGKKLAVVGGGDTAVEDALYLTRFSSEVHIIHRRDQFRAQRIIQERALTSARITVHWDSVVDEISGSGLVERVAMKNVRTGERSSLDVSGVFILVGSNPSTKFLQEQVKLDENGYILTDENMQTSLPGVFAAGDARHKLLRQIITACADGAIAATAAEKLIDGLLI